MVGAWDPWCVAEDADIAGWLARNGYSVAMIPDSWTLEEAPHSLVKSAKQRARWGKGYAQAGAVQSRHPIRSARQMGLRPLFAYTLMTIGTPLSLMLNPVFWSLTIGYLVTRSQFIHDLFPTPVFLHGVRDGDPRQLHSLLPPGDRLPVGPGAGAREVHARTRPMVAVHQLLHVEGRSRTVRAATAIPLARNGTRHRRPAHGTARNTAPSPTHVSKEAGRSAMVSRPE